ncbi:MAG: hypothetical protein KIT09_30885 [Bryobacteraceae bacterium]|nr:hypothetical protein [Bryobacteraceae bacterium]
MRAAERLVVFRTELEARRGHAKLGELVQATEMLAEILVEEQNSWYRQTSRLGVHL